MSREETRQHLPAHDTPTLTHAPSPQTRATQNTERNPLTDEQKVTGHFPPGLCDSGPKIKVRSRQGESRQLGRPRSETDTRRQEGADLQADSAAPRQPAPCCPREGRQLTADREEGEQGEGGTRRGAKERDTKEY